MLRVGKYDWKSKTQPVTKDYINVLIHIHEPLSPYQLRNENKVIMENFWQFHKLYTSTEKQDQPKFPYWQQEEEIHWDKNLEVPTEAYWKWREKGFACEGAVRYPNGYQKRSTCRSSIVVDQKAKKGFQELDYITARKKIYYSEYARLARKTKEFKELQTQLQKDTKLQINEVDGPPLDVTSAPFDRVINGSLEVTRENVKLWLENPKYSFGHGICLTVALLDWDDLMD